MRLRFTIRDLLWLTALMALAVGWWLDHWRLTAWEDVGGPGIIEGFPPIRCFVRPDGTIGNDPALDPPKEEGEQ
jgi:hypothetical protein